MGKEYFVQETGSCMLCSRHCNGCVGPTPRDCLKCHNYMFFSRCVSLCPLGFTPQELEPQEIEVMNGKIKCQMSQSIAALFALSAFALIWFTIVVCCKWRKSRKLLKTQPPPSNSIALREVNTSGLGDAKFNASEPSLMLTRLPSSNSLTRNDKVLVSPSGSGSDRQTPPRTLYGGTSLQL